MADKKISELDALTGVDTADDDRLVIVDTSAGLTKSITMAEFKNAFDTGSGFVRITGDTMTGNLSFGDNDKAIFGAGSDLAIFSNGTDSFIQEYTTGGHLYIDGTNVRIRNRSDNTLRLQTSDSGAVDLYYAGSTKLATTNTGVDITGTLTSDGLTVDSGSTDTVATFESSGDAKAYIVVKDSGSSDGAFFGADGTDTIIGTGGSAERIRISSAGSVGIGTSSIDNKVNIQESALAGRSASNGNTSLTLEHATDTGIQFFSATQTQLRFGDAASTGAGSIIYAHGDDSLRVSTNASEAMRIDSSGNVGIGCIPLQPLHLVAADGTLALFSNGVDADLNIKTASGVALLTPSTGTLAFGTSNTERMRIDSSGRVGIGCSPTAGFRTSIKGDYSSIIGGIELDSGGGDKFTIGHASATSPSGKLNVVGAGNLIMQTNNTERMRIDSSGNVGINEPSPDAKLHIRDATDGGSSSITSAIQFSRRSGGANDAAIKMQHDGSDGVSNLQFYFGSSEAMRIDSSGNLLVGKTSSAFATAGIELQADAELVVTRNGSTASFNRLSEGSILDFYESGALAGSIGSISDDLLIGTGNTGLRFYDAGNAIIPRTAAGGTVNGTIDLGGSSAINSQFKDLYLSGGVKLPNCTLEDQVIKSNTFIFKNGAGSERMRLDANGKLGIGQVPVTDWSSTYDALQVGAQGVMFAHTSGGGDASTWITNNAYVSSSGWKALSTNEASHYQQKNGEHYWSTAPSVSSGAALSFSTRMRIGANGAIYRGSASANSTYTYAELTHSHAGNDASNNADISFTITFTNGSTTYDNVQIIIDAATHGNSAPASVGAVQLEVRQRASSLQVLSTTNPIYGDSLSVTTSTSGLTLTVNILSSGNSTFTVGARCRVLTGYYGLTSLTAANQ